MNQKLTDFIKKNGNLKIVLNEKGREELPILIDSFGNDTVGAMYELIEHQICNGWELLKPEEIGALTACELIITEEAERDEDGELVKVGRVYWHERYQVEDAFEELVKNGSVTLDGVENEDDA